MSGFDFDSANFNLTSIGKYLENEGINLSQDDKQKLNTIFNNCDIYDDNEGKEGKDGDLNNKEWNDFVKNIEKKLPAVLDKIKNFRISLITEKMLQKKREAEFEKLGVRDATYVAPKFVEEKILPKEKPIEIIHPKMIDKNSDIRTKYDWSEEEFNKVLLQMLDAPRYHGKFKNSVLRNKGKEFIEVGKKYNIDPRILVSIAMVESERGISSKARNLNNVGGLIINGKYHHFNSVAESIDSIAKTIDTRYKEGFTTLNKIGNSGRYCAKSAATSWILQAGTYFRFFDKYYKVGE